MNFRPRREVTGRKHPWRGSKEDVTTHCVESRHGSALSSEARKHAHRLEELLAPREYPPLAQRGASSAD
jgi:hypothetical protein